MNLIVAIALWCGQDTYHNSYFINKCREDFMKCVRDENIKHPNSYENNTIINCAERIKFK